MSQFTFGNIDETTTDGYDLAALLEEFESAVNSDHSGPTAPVYAIQGMRWRDTSATPHLIKIYDGTSWIVTGEINPSTHVYKPWNNGAVLGALSGYGVGNGLEVDSSNLRVKLDGSTLARGTDGLKVASKGIGLGNIADGTDGGLWTWRADGVAKLLAPGNHGEVLHSAGAGAELYWATAASGLELIGASSVVGVASASITFDPAVYKSVTLFLRNMSAVNSAYQTGTFIRPMINGSAVAWTSSIGSLQASSLDQSNFFFGASRYSRSWGGRVDVFNTSGPAPRVAKLTGATYTADYPNTNTDTVKDINCTGYLNSSGSINGLYLYCAYISATGSPVWNTGSEIALYGVRN